MTDLVTSGSLKREVAVMARITFEGREYTVGPGEKVLDALLSEGAKVPYSCRRGSCHTCTLQVAPEEENKIEGNCLPQNLREAGLFLPCVTRVTGDVKAKRPDWSSCFLDASIVERKLVTDGVLHVTLETPLRVTWHAGQQVELRTDGGKLSLATIASVRATDYYLDMLVAAPALAPAHAGAPQTSTLQLLQQTTSIQFRGPLGSVYYDKRHHETRHLRLRGVGVEAQAALIALSREARLWNHPEQVTWYDEDGRRLPTALDRAIDTLTVEWPMFQRRPWKTAEAEATSAGGSWKDSAFFAYGPDAEVDDACALALRLGCPPQSVLRVRTA